MDLRSLIYGASQENDTDNDNSTENNDTQDNAHFPNASETDSSVVLSHVASDEPSLHQREPTQFDEISFELSDQDESKDKNVAAYDQISSLEFYMAGQERRKRLLQLSGTNQNENSTSDKLPASAAVYPAHELQPNNMGMYDSLVAKYSKNQEDVSQTDIDTIYARWNEWTAVRNRWRRRRVDVRNEVDVGNAVQKAISQQRKKQQAVAADNSGNNENVAKTLQRDGSDKKDNSVATTSKKTSMKRSQHERTNLASDSNSHIEPVKKKLRFSQQVEANDAADMASVTSSTSSVDNPASVFGRIMRSTQEEEEQKQEIDEERKRKQSMPYADLLDYWDLGYRMPRERDLERKYDSEVTIGMSQPIDVKIKAETRSTTTNLLRVTRPYKFPYMGDDADASLFHMNMKTNYNSNLFHHRHLRLLAAKFIVATMGTSIFDANRHKNEQRLLKVLWHPDHPKFYTKRMQLDQTSRNFRAFLTFIHHLWSDRHKVARLLNVSSNLQLYESDLVDEVAFCRIVIRKYAIERVQWDHNNLTSSQLKSTKDEELTPFTIKVDDMVSNEQVMPKEDQEQPHVPIDSRSLKSNSSSGNDDSDSSSNTVESSRDSRMSITGEKDVHKFDMTEDSSDNDSYNNASNSNNSLKEIDNGSGSASPVANRSVKYAPPDSDDDLDSLSTYGLSSASSNESSVVSSGTSQSSQSLSKVGTKASVSSKVSTVQSTVADSYLEATRLVEPKDATRATKGSGKRNFGCIELSPTSRYVHLAGNVPPVPTFPLDESRILLGPADQYIHVYQTCSVAEEAQLLTVCSLLNKIMMAQGTDNRHIVTTTQEQLHVMLVESMKANQHNTVTHPSPSYEYPLYASYDSILRYCSIGAAGLLAEEDIGKEQANDEQSLSSTDSKSLPSLRSHLQHVLVTTERYRRDAGVQMFSRLHFVQGMLDFAVSLPPEALDLLTELYTTQQNPVDIMWRLMSSIEEFPGFVDSQRSENNAVGVLILDYTLAQAQREMAICVTRSPLDTDYTTWHIAVLAARLVLLSGRRITDTNRYDCVRTEQSGYVSVRKELLVVFKSIVEMLMDVPSSKLYHTFVSLLQWPQLVYCGILHGQAKSLGLVEQLHGLSRYLKRQWARSSMTSTSLDQWKTSLKGKNEGIEHAACQLECDAESVDNWRVFVQLIIPFVKTGGTCNSPTCTDCKFVVDGHCLDHTGLDAIRQDGWANQSRSSWWDKCLLNYRTQTQTCGIGSRYKMYNVINDTLSGLTISTIDDTVVDEAMTPDAIDLSWLDDLRKSVRSTDTKTKTSDDEIYNEDDAYRIRHMLSGTKPTHTNTEALLETNAANEVGVYKVVVLCQMYGMQHPAVVHRIIDLVRKCWHGPSNSLKEDCDAWTCLKWLYTLGVNIPMYVKEYNLLGQRGVLEMSAKAYKSKQRKLESSLLSDSSEAESDESDSIGDESDGDQ